MRSDDFRLSLEKVDLFLFDKTSDAVSECVEHLVFALSHSCAVGVQSFALNAHLSTVSSVSVDVRRMHECLCRDAASVETCAAKAVLFSDGYLHAEVCRIERSLIAARTRSDDKEVIIEFAHIDFLSLHLLFSRRGFS